MIINTNNLSSQLNNALSKSMENLAISSRKLASGDKFVAGGGKAAELTLSTAMRSYYKGSESLLTGLEHATGYASMQESIMDEVGNILTRMGELIGASLDTTKTSSDRTALDEELNLLQQELIDLGDNELKYNDQSLFGTALGVRFGMETDDVLTLSAVSLAVLASLCKSLCISTATAADAALVSLDGSIMEKFGKLAALSSSHSKRVGTTLRAAQNHVTHLKSVESLVRNVDVAQETAEFVAQQVVVNAAQAMIAQANIMPQSAMRFFNF